jgi:hypothetical protein
LTADEELRRKIRLILGQVKPSDRIYRYTESDVLLENLRAASEPDAPRVADVKDTTIVNEQILLLKVLRGQGGHSETDFVTVLSEEVSADNATVVVHTLIDVGRLDAVLALRKAVKASSLHFRAALWTAVGEKLRREPHRFTDKDLDAIDDARTKDHLRMHLG